jgi:hypothetical protein
MNKPQNSCHYRSGRPEFSFITGALMNDLDLFLALPINAQAAVVCFVACASWLFVIILTAPRRNCFFLRWRPERRLLALLVSPTLIVLWPIVLYGWFLRSRGIEPDDPEFGDE